MYSTNDKTLNIILAYTQDLYKITPNNFNNKHISSVFKILSSHLKQHPLILFLPIAVAISCAVGLLYGDKIIALAKLIRIGF